MEGGKGGDNDDETVTMLSTSWQAHTVTPRRCAAVLRTLVSQSAELKSEPRQSDSRVHKLNH